MQTAFETRSLTQRTKSWMFIPFKDLFLFFGGVGLVGGNGSGHELI